MKQAACAMIVPALVLALAVEVRAGGTRISASSGWSTFAAQSDAVPSSKSSSPVYHVPHHGHGLHHHFHHHGFVPGPGVIVVPYLPYAVPPIVVVNAPYFCLLHRTGFVSRIGMLDHLAGNHKLPFRAAAAICPAGADKCIFPSY
jgi:hypothetical protein